MLTSKNIDQVTRGLALKKLKVLGLAAIASVFMMTEAQAQETKTKRQVKKEHAEMIASQAKLFKSWADYIEWKWVRDFMATEIARYKHDDEIFESKVLKASETQKDPVLMKKEIVAKALAEAMKLFKSDLETWVIWFDNHMKSSNKIYTVKWWNADWWSGYGHSSHWYDANLSFDPKVYGRSWAKESTNKYNTFLNKTFKEFKSGAEQLRSTEDSNNYQTWLPQQTLETYTAVEEQTKTWLEGIYDVLIKQLFSTNNHTPKK